MSYQLPEVVANRLLESLASDDAVRAEFIANPRQVLANLGFEPAGDPAIEGGIWSCLTVENLASKEAIQATQGALKRQLCAQRASYQPILLGYVPSARLVA
jgi:putative modified peptide